MISTKRTGAHAKGNGGCAACGSGRGPTSAMACLLASLLALACSGEEGGDDPPLIRFVSPAPGTTVRGLAEIELDVVNATERHALFWGLEGEELVPARFLASSFAIKTDAHSNGEYEVVAELRDGDDGVANAALPLTFDNPEFKLLSYATDQDAYSAGQLVRLELEYDRAGLEVGADFSALESTFDAAGVATTDLGDGRYRVEYRLSTQIDVVDDFHPVTVAASDESGDTLETRVDVASRRLPSIPFSVSGGILVDAPPPALDEDASAVPFELDGDPIPLLTGTSLSLDVRWPETPEVPVDRLLISAEGWHGHFVQRVPPGASELEITLENLKADVDGAIEVEIVAVGDNGLSSGTQTTTIEVADVGLGGLQVTLFWDAPVDLDLSVVDPSGALVDFETPRANGGVLNLDANALCEIGPAFAENVSWVSGEALPGDYDVRVNLFDACGYDGEINWWIVGVAGLASDVQFKDATTGSVTGINFNGTISSSSTDTTGSGMSAGPPVTVGAVQTVGGTIRFKKNPKGTFKEELARFVPVRAVSAVDNATVFGEGRTDGTGVYSLTLNNPSSEAYSLVVEASYATSATSAPLAQVLPIGGGAQVLTATGPVIPASSGSSTQQNLTIEPSNNAGAFNIVDNMRKAYDWVFSHWANAPLGPVAARWTRGASSPTSYNRGQNRIRLNGATADPDEFDDSVIIHEFMHYVYDELVSPNAPVAAHSAATRAAPGVAFSEGLSTAVAQQVLRDPVYVDKKNNNTKVGKTNIETNATAIFKDHSPKTMLGNLSEYLVAMLLWDLFDPVGSSGADPADQLDEPNLTADTFLRDLGARTNRAAPDLDLVDYFDGWRCRSGASASGVFAFDTQLMALAAERVFRYDFLPNPACP